MKYIYLTCLILFSILPGDAGGVKETSFLIFLLLSMTENAIDEKWGLLLWAETFFTALFHSSFECVSLEKKLKCSYSSNGCKWKCYWWADGDNAFECIHLSLKYLHKELNN